MCSSRGSQVDCSVRTLQGQRIEFRFPSHPTIQQIRTLVSEHEQSPLDAFSYTCTGSYSEQQGCSGLTSEQLPLQTIPGCVLKAYQGYPKRDFHCAAADLSYANSVAEAHSWIRSDGSRHAAPDLMKNAAMCAALEARLLDATLEPDCMILLNKDAVGSSMCDHPGELFVHSAILGASCAVFHWRRLVLSWSERYEVEPRCSAATPVRLQALRSRISFAESAWWSPSNTTTSFQLYQEILEAHRQALCDQPDAWSTSLNFIILLLCGANHFDAPTKDALVDEALELLNQCVNVETLGDDACELVAQAQSIAVFFDDFETTRIQHDHELPVSMPLDKLMSRSNMREIRRLWLDAPSCCQGDHLRHVPLILDIDDVSSCSPLEQPPFSLQSVTDALHVAYNPEEPINFIGDRLTSVIRFFFRLDSQRPQLMQRLQVAIFASPSLDCLALARDYGYCQKPDHLRGIDFEWFLVHTLSTFESSELPKVIGNSSGLRCSATQFHPQDQHVDDESRLDILHRRARALEQILRSPSVQLTKAHGGTPVHRPIPRYLCRVRPPCHLPGLDITSKPLLLSRTLAQNKADGARVRNLRGF